MKKYVKPELFYERFELNQHIADCLWELNSGNDQNCNATADSKLGYSERLFTSDGLGCEFIPGVNYEMYCYTTGSNGVNVFKS